MVFISYIELYNNVLYDLLSFDQPSSNILTLHDTHEGVQISGSSTIRTPVSSAEEALEMIARGNKIRATSSTNLNERSSRSHTVVSFEIVTQEVSGGVSSGGSSTPKSRRPSMSVKTKVGKINLVDLAGSERVKMSGAEGQTLEEAKSINKALTFLGDVLSSLSKYHVMKAAAAAASKDIGTLSPIRPPHIPYRNSKLTMLLKDSLCGNAKTMMISTIRTGSLFYQQTLMCLRYAVRAKEIKLKPIQNRGDSDPQGGVNSMKKTLSEVDRLKDRLRLKNIEFEN